ncbi:MAG TPA: acyltransferase [Candidatus Binatia bacterium]|jgi:peptidoglycan/LPS O-acetylase OafA/YrhL
MRQHTNAFDLLRLLGAGLVLWSHQYALLGLPETTVDPFRTTLGGLGVAIFFIISGYLNTLSAVRHGAIAAFLFSRAFRIYPALIICVGFTVLLGIFVAPDIKTYFDIKLLSFIGKDITLFTGIKAGVSHPVFAGNVLPNALNGSLWTLPYEVKLYVALAASVAVLRYNPVVSLVVAGCALLAMGMTTLDRLWLQLPALFIVGCFVAAIRRVANLAVAIVVLAGLAGFFATIGHALFANYLLLGAAVVSFGSVNVPKWLRPPLDLSYAIYLYAFPIEQLGAHLTKNFWLALLFSAAMTVLLAFLSVLFVEQPAQTRQRDMREWIRKTIIGGVRQKHLKGPDRDIARQRRGEIPGSTTLTTDP